MLLSLENPNKGFVLTYTGILWKSAQGRIFITGIILFMGIAEILAKDLRDKINDAEGGRNTFVNYVGVELSTKILIFFAWFGYILWMVALYLGAMFPYSIAAWFCLVIGLIWCVQIYILCSRLTKEFNQVTAATLHERWTYVYTLMQVLTFVSFCFK